MCDDADLDYAVTMALRGAFLNAGQNCLSSERFFVYDAIYDKFLDRVLNQMPKISLVGVMVILSLLQGP